jgi:heptosyltransferase-2
MGDIILTQPVVATLRKLYPEASIDFITKPQYSELVKLIKEVNHVIEWKNVVSSKNEIQAKKYDIVIDLHKKGTSFIIKKLCRARKIVAYNKKHLLRWAIINKWTNKSIFSTLDLYYSALKKLSIAPCYDMPKLQLHVPVSLIPGKFLKIAVFPGATHPTKRLPLEKWIALCNRIAEQWQVEIFINGSLDEKKISNELFEQIQTKMKKNLCGTQSISELAFFLADMDLVISNDSGPMHLAAALEKPQIAFFGSTATSLGFRPLNEKSLVFQTLFPCQPCALHGRRKCPLKHFKCMNNIDINIVFDELKKLF